MAGQELIQSGSSATSADLNLATNAQILNVETISAAAAASFVTINLQNQSEGFTISGSGQGDTLTGGSGADIINGAGGNDMILGFVGADIVDGGGGYKYDPTLRDLLADLNSATNAQIVNIQNVSVVGASTGVAIDLHTQSEGFTITGSSFADTLIGGTGSDKLNGGSGADALAGGAGNDVYLVDDLGDTITELSGAGTDKTETTLNTYSLAGAANVEKSDIHW